MEIADCANAIEKYAEWCGGVHDEGCPADDTCICSGKWINDGVTAAINYLRRVPSHFPDTPALRQARVLADDLVRIGSELDKEARLFLLADRWRQLAAEKAKGGPYQEMAAAMLGACARELEAMLREK